MRYDLGRRLVSDLVDTINGWFPSLPPLPRPVLAEDDSAPVSGVQVKAEPPAPDVYRIPVGATDFREVEVGGVLCIVWTYRGKRYGMDARSRRAKKRGVRIEKPESVSLHDMFRALESALQSVPPTVAAA